MARPSLYSTLLVLLVGLVGLYIVSVAFIGVGWDFVLIKLTEMSPQAALDFFNRGHQFLMTLTWVVIVFHGLVVLTPSLTERFNPRWFSHVAVLALAWLTLVQPTFSPAEIAPPPPPAKNIPAPQPTPDNQKNFRHLNDKIGL